MTTPAAPLGPRLWVRSFEERLLFPVALYYMLGIVLGAQWIIPINYGLLVMLVLAMLAATLYALRRNLLLCALALSLCAGVTAVNIALPAWAWDPWAPPEPVEFTGRIVQARIDPEQTVRYVLDDVTIDGQPLAGRVRVTAAEDSVLAQHGTYAATVRLSRPHGTQFYGGFNGRGYQMRQGVRFYAYADGPEDIRELQPTGPAALLQRFRGYAHGVLYSRLSPRSAALVDALLSGNRDGIDDTTSGAFNRLGAAHLLAVSGLNITLTAGAAWLLLRRLRVPMALAVAGSLLVLAGYVAYAGLSPSVARAAVAWLTVLAARLAARRYDGLSALSAAALVLLAVNPLDLFDVGFQLSFTAVAAILLWMGPLERLLPRRRKVLRRLAGAMGVTVTVQIMALPLLLYYFNTLPLVSPLSNLIMVPVSEMLQLGGMALLAVGWLDAAAQAVGGLLDGCVRLYLDGALWLAARAPVLAAPSPPLWVALAFGGAALGLSPSVVRLGRRGHLGVAAVALALAMAMVWRWPQPPAYRCDAAVLAEQGSASLFWQQGNVRYVACAGQWDAAAAYAAKRGLASVDVLYFLPQEPPPDGTALRHPSLAVKAVVVPGSWPADPAAVAFLQDASALGIVVKTAEQVREVTTDDGCATLRLRTAGRDIAYVAWMSPGGEEDAQVALAGAGTAVLCMSAKRATGLDLTGIGMAVLPDGVAEGAARAYNMDACASLALLVEGEQPWAGEWADGLQGSFR